MPVYLCQPGIRASEPWRHGLQVYAAPFAMEVETAVEKNDSATEEALSHEAAAWTDSGENLSPPPPPTTTTTTNIASEHHKKSTGHAIRRVRHAEVVLVDDVCIAFERYWLRLRWPGRKGGFAGYIALGKVGQTKSWLENSGSSREIKIENEHGDTFVAVEHTSSEDVQQQQQRALHSSTIDTEEDRAGTEDLDLDDPTRDDEPQDNASTFSSEPFESTAVLKCLRTGLSFPSSVAMKLLAIYDDGLSPPVTSAPLPSEPVFCRICREGLHDDADDEQPSPAMENDVDDTNATGQRGASSSPSESSINLANYSSQMEDDEGNEPAAAEPLWKGPVTPHPQYHPNPGAAENPMLAPCECSGSMAFVHYMCVEQWRCRSRHPDARQGLQCETCSKPYALPPPSSRPSSVLHAENEDWLEAMPPHVMAALRQPHIWWQIGAAIVRRRWLRPVAPVIMSPVVALYCRARRLLKKKGVARRRWACSLCRRRARWKCVRCLRSYYCSRQCQNVSWHIVHKHVCYKPSRWGWSLVVYGALTLLLFPGILRDPLMYDLGLGFVPASFYVMAVLGGGFATFTKTMVGLDLRGRSFEMIVILATVWLVFCSWALVSAFFGDTSRCHGTLGSYPISSLDDNPSWTLKALSKVVFTPAESWFLMWDRLALNSGHWVRKTLCSNQVGAEGCFEHLHKANADFFLEEYGGSKCASDIQLVSGLFLGAGFVAAGSHLWKQRERQRRAARRRPHQD